MTKKVLPMPLRRWLRRTLRNAGYDIIAFPRLQLLSQLGVNVLFDVGASEGLYAEEMRQLGYAGRIVSFEPRSTAFARLSRRASRDPKWEALQVALGREATASVIHISGAPDSSSLLDILPRQYDAIPDIAYVGEEPVDVRALDDLYETYCRSSDVAFLKLDVQGYESHVLQGAARTLDRLAGLQLELSLTPLYDGETLFADLIRHLQDRGFAVAGIEPGLRDGPTGQLLQVDALFVRA